MATTPVPTFAHWRQTCLAAIASGDASHDIYTTALSATRNVALIQAETKPAEHNSAQPKLVPNHMICRAAEVVAVPTASTPSTSEQRVLRFIRLVQHLSTAPWASVQFDANANIMNKMIAAHMSLITGKSKNARHLYALIDPSASLWNIQNLVWITNRQQGKTTTLGKFLAAISLAAQNSGTCLACVYSTKLERAGELLAAARQYLYWMQQPEGQHPEWQNITFDRDNEKQYNVSVNGGPVQVVFARPKSPDTCRGDAFRLGLFDEVAFTSPSFWFTFAVPLMMVKDRRFTCTTTPPPPKSFFDDFVTQVKENMARGDNFFELTNHSLACSRCIDAGDALRCVHKLALIPPWKPILNLSSLSGLMPKNRAAAFAQEVYGVMKHRFNAYLPEKLIKAAFLDRARLTNPLTDGVPTIWVGIDPASHGKSDMGLVAIVAAETVCVLGCGSVNATRCQIIELQAVIAEFLRKVRSHWMCDRASPIVPIIECNNNEVMATSLLAVFRNYGPVFMPWTPDRFDKHITDGVGVWTTEDNKLAMLQVCYQLLLEGRVAVATDVITVDAGAFDTRAKRCKPDTAVKLLATQLAQFTDDERTGKVTGKTSSGDNDDVGMAFLMAVYWRLCALAADASIQ